MKGPQSAALILSLLGSFSASAESGLIVDHGANSASAPLSQNLKDRAPGNDSREQIAVPRPQDTTTDTKPRALQDPKLGCTARPVGTLSADTVAWAGLCTNGLASGAGTATFSNQGKVIARFTGIFTKGNLHDGHVIVQWSDGSNYDGNFAAGRMEGPGKLVTGAGDRFEGQWASDHLNGHGLAVWANGDRYEGEWRDGKAEGHGVQVWADGHSYDGAWHNDLPNGHGIVTRKDGSRYEGEFADGLPKQTMQLAGPTGASDASHSAVTPGSSAGVDNNNASAADAARPARRSGIADVAGKKFYAVDGSTLTLTATDSGLTREIVGPSGTVKKDQFAFVNDKLGTVADGDDNANVTGVFRLTPNGIATDYSDGRSEILNANSAGGVSIVLNAPGGDSFCMAWYPQGHAFSTEERKAALAEYANRLGLAEPHQASHRPAAKPDCGFVQSESADAVSAPRNASRHTAPPSKLVPVPRARSVTSQSSMRRDIIPVATPASLTISSSPPPGATIEVRDSRVHPVDTAMPPAALSQDANDVASNEPAAVPGASASTCLSVESDGHHWSFKNHCGYDVQFAYCLKNADDPLASCNKGSINGSVSPHGFSALIADKSLNETNADHDFRWVACGGGAGEVVVHLDRSDPPAGRCVRPDAS